MAACTNDRPCGVGKPTCSAVCRKLAEQGVKREVVATTGVTRVESDRERAKRLGGRPTLEAAALGARPGVPLTDALVGCSCGEVTMSRAAAREKDWPVVAGVEHRYSLPCREHTPDKKAPTLLAGDVTWIPERAGRPGDQPLPVPGGQSVFAEVRRRLDEREATGVRRYGRSLETFNGRDAALDLEEELLDGLAYVTQLRLEHAAVVEALVTLGRFCRPIHCLGRPFTAAEQAAIGLALKLEGRLRR